MRPARSSSAPVSSRQPRGELRRGHAGGPHDGARRDPLGFAGAVIDGHRLGVDPDHGRAEHRRDTDPLERSLRLGRQRWREAREHSIGGLDQQDAAAPRDRPRRSRRASVSRASSPIWPAISTPVGPAPTTTNVSQAAVTSGSVSALGRLERAQDPAPDGQRALERLDLGRELAPLVVPEVGVARATGDDQRVVGHRRGRGYLADRAQMNQRARRGRSRRPRPAARWTLRSPLEDRPQRIRDLAGDSAPVATW